MTSSPLRARGAPGDDAAATRPCQTVVSEPPGTRDADPDCPSPPLPPALDRTRPGNPMAGARGRPDPVPDRSGLAGPDTFSRAVGRPHPDARPLGNPDRRPDGNPGPVANPGPDGHAFRRPNGVSDPRPVTDSGPDRHAYAGPVSDP